MFRSLAVLLAASLGLAVIAACGGGGGGSPADATPPTITISSPPAENSATNADSPSFTLGADEPATICWQLDGGATTCSASGATSFGANLVALSAGPHTLSVTATDSAANVGSATRHWTIDLTAPAITISEPPAQGASTSVSMVNFTLTADEPAIICWELDGGAPTCSPSPITITTTGDHAVSLGPNSLSVQATDSAGNLSNAARSWTRI